jgi:hypothetical protein
MLSVDGLIGLNGPAHFELVADLSALIAARLNYGTRAFISNYLTSNK